MPTHTRTDVIRRHDIPAEVLAMGEMAAPDYVDLFVATTPAALQASPEQWARATMEGASELGRFLAWQTVLALQLERGFSPERIAGWRIAHRGDTWIRVEASSWCMTANIVFALEASQVSFATFIGYDRPVARLLWRPVSAVHRAVAPDFLRDGVRRIAESSG
ncbi:MAG TPA: hypothetical protein VNA30_05995 [Mycobacteriales bacterium]|nr:hypothetical protein [Mycobacteriales bacterium]